MVKKQSIQNMLVIVVLFAVLSFNFYKSMSMNYNSTGHIEIKVFRIQSTDTHSLMEVIFG